MKHLREQAKAGHKSKIKSYAGNPKNPIDASDFKKLPPLSTSKSTGLLPIGDQAAPLSVREGTNVEDGARAAKRLDRVPRKSGGKVHSDAAEDKKLISKMVKPSCRSARADGGRVKGGKGKTNINIVIAPGGGPQADQAQKVPVPIPVPQQAPPASPMSAMPPGAGGMPPGAGGPPMGGIPMRKAGGRVNKDVPVKKPGRTSDGYAKMDYGALGGKGRRQKILAQ